MSANEHSLLTMFFAVASITALWRIVRDRDWKNFQLQNFRTSWKFMLGLGAVFAVLFSALFFAEANYANASFALVATSFFGSFLIPFVFSELNVAPFIRSIVLLLLSVALTLMVPTDHLSGVLGFAIAGLSTWKLSSSLLRPDSATLLDYLSPLVWLTSFIWWTVAHINSVSSLNLGLILGVLTVSIFMRWVQMPLLWEDPVYLKRVVLSISSGLMVLIISNKLLLAPQYAQLSAVAGGGFLVAFILDSLGRYKGDSGVQDVLTKLTIIGALTLLVERMYGCEGLLVLAAAAVIVAKSGLAQVAGIFWTLRVLQQSYTEQFNSNVTGININHEYVGAALYFGLTAAVVLAIALRKYKHGQLLAAAVPLTALIAAVGASYLIHAEPTASLIVGALVGSTTLAIAGVEIFGSDSSHAQNLIITPAILTSFGLVVSPLLTLGETATIHDRLMGIVAIGVLLILGSLVSIIVSGGFRRKPKVSEANAS
jgi:hypothetical protein